jgi:hypothetical protein
VPEAAAAAPVEEVYPFPRCSAEVWICRDAETSGRGVRVLKLCGDEPALSEDGLWKCKAFTTPLPPVMLPEVEAGTAARCRLSIDLLEAPPKPEEGKYTF